MKRILREPLLLLLVLGAALFGVNALLSARAPRRADPTSTFSQVFLDPSRHEDLATDAARLLVHLRRSGATPDITTLGDPFLLGHWFDKLPAREVKSQFGEKFATSLDSLAPGQWQGPIASRYGAHLVFVHGRSASGERGPR